MITDIFVDDVQLNNSRRYCRGIQNLSFPSLPSIAAGKASMEGQRLTVGKFTSYKFGMDWQLIGSSFSDLASQREEFEKILGSVIASGGKTLKISKSNGVGVQIEIKRTAVTGDITAEDGNGSAMMVECEAEYPFLMSQTLQSVDAHIFKGGGMRIPMSIPLNMSRGGSNTTVLSNNGTIYAYPVFTFSGPLENPTLFNVTTQKTLNISYKLNSVTDRIVVDTFLRTVLLYTGDARTGVNLRGSVSGDFWTLQAGDNEVRLGNAAYNALGKCNISFRDHYLGI